MGETRKYLVTFYDMGDCDFMYASVDATSLAHALVKGAEHCQEAHPDVFHEAYRADVSLAMRGL